MIKMLLKCIAKRVHRGLVKAWEWTWIKTLGMPVWMGAMIMVLITLLLLPLAVAASMIEAGCKELALWWPELRRWLLTSIGRGGDDASTR